MQTENYSYFEIISCLDRLNIKREDQPNHKGWLSILCPYHQDENFGSCSINLNSGVLSCFPCNKKRHILGVIQDFQHCSFDEAKRFIKNSFSFDSKIEVVEKPKKKISKLGLENLILTEFDPSRYDYTKSRGFTLDFCKKFNIQLCLTKKYEDYFIIPIKDITQNIETFEARKLKKKERLCSYYEKEYSYELEERFEGYCLRNKIKFHRGRLLKEGKPINDEFFYYMLKPKVLYPINDGNIGKVIFNNNNLDRKKVLYLCEGFGTIPKIYLHISENVTCFFGVGISEKQIGILNEFEEIYHIPDYDRAGYESVKFLNSVLKNKYKIIDLNIDDTSPDFVKQVKESKPLFPQEYLVKHFNRF